MRTLPILVGLGLLLWMLLGAWWMNNNRADCLGFDATSTTTIEENITPAVAPPPASTDAFSITDEGFRASAPQGILFGLSNNTPIISNPTNEALQQLATYMNGKAERKVTLLGTYSSDEENTTNFLNLGLARAGAVKERLVGMGVASSRIELNGVQTDDVEVRNDTLFNGLDFRFANITTLGSDDDINKLKTEILIEPATIYFATNSANVNLEERFKVKVQNLKTYLRSVEGTTVTVSGHTDNVGNTASNIALSQRRAAQVKDYLVQQGFEESRINVVGQGPNVPIADNTTPEGKAKNRRVEIQLDN